MEKKQIYASISLSRIHKVKLKMELREKNICKVILYFDNLLKNEDNFLENNMIN